MANFPTDLIISSSSFESETSIFRSESINGIRTIREQPNHRFKFSLDLAIDKHADFRKHFGYLSSLKSGVNKITIVHPAFQTILGSATSCVVNGGSQNGTLINLDGFASSQNGVLLQGDIIKFTGDTKVYMVLEDVNSNASGESTVNVLPALRQSPSDNAIVQLTACEFTMSVTGFAKMDVVAPMFATMFKLTLIEELI